MLSARIVPSLVKYAQIRYASYQPVIMQSMTLGKISTSTTGNKPNRYTATSGGGGFANSSPIAKHSNFIVHRSFATEPKLPSKSELEKYFFKITVVIWDLGCRILAWAWAMFKKNVIQNPSVQSYWKTFNQKLSEARKN